jgi:hypothetical protein
MKNTIAVLQLVSIFCAVTALGSILDHRVGMLTVWAAAGFALTCWAWGCCKAPAGPRVTPQSPKPHIEPPRNAN